MIYFTSDLHFGHANILKPEYCDRPWDNVAEMNRGLVENWNSVVKPQDEVWILGDCHCGRKSDKVALTWLPKCNGKKHLVKGNHDRPEFLEQAEAYGIFKSIQDYAELKYNKTKFVLLHYPMRAWNGSHRGSIHLYGHTHGTREGVGRSMDVGVDAVGYKPISIDEVYERMMKIEVKILHH